jgi:hypothetical protein
MNSVFRCFRRFAGLLSGLLVLTVAWQAPIMASLVPLSGPLRPLGIAQLLRLDLSDAERAGRIVMLYHSPAMPFVAAFAHFRFRGRNCRESSRIGNVRLGHPGGACSSLRLATLLQLTHEMSRSRDDRAGATRIFVP